MKIHDRKSLHLAISHPLYVKLKIAAFERMLSLNEVVNGILWLVASKDKQAVNLLDRLAKMKYEDTLRERIYDEEQRAKVDLASLYDLIHTAEETP